jgi:hypothetical protein
MPTSSLPASLSALRDRDDRRDAVAAADDHAAPELLDLSRAAKRPRQVHDLLALLHRGEKPRRGADYLEDKFDRTLLRCLNRRW